MYVCIHVYYRSLRVFKVYMVATHMYVFTYVCMLVCVYKYACVCRLLVFACPWGL